MFGRSLLSRAVFTEGWRHRLRSIGINDDLAAEIAKLVRPNLLLIPNGATSDTAVPVGQSKLGGLPDLARDAQWPIRSAYSYRTDHFHNENPAAREVQPLSFLAQVNLADVASMGGTNLSLPENGLLSFFYDAEIQPWGFDPLDAPGFKLLWSDTQELTRHEFPARLPEAARFRTVSLRLEPSECPPPPESLVVAGILRTLPDPAEARHDLFGMFDEPRLAKFVSFENALGGWPQPIQNEMETECQLASNGIYCGGPEAYKGEKYEQTRAGASDWRLILQLDSNDDAGWMWGDAGKLYIWMREQDIEGRRFDRCWTILQCY